MSIQLKEAALPDGETHETFRASRSDGELAALLEFILFRTGLMPIAESGVKRRSNISWTLGHNVRGYRFVTLLTQLQSRVPSRTRAIFHKNTSNFSFDQVLVAVPRN